MEQLSNPEIKRYSRQLILPGFGVTAQRQLKSSSALIVGCGGLGCPAAIYLAAAGIGKLGLLDHDDVEISNLHRQILHRESGTGEPKCKSAANACRGINSLPEYCQHRIALASSNALDIVKDYDVVLDCTDNVATRYLLNDACVLLKKPLVSGAALKFEGQLTVYNYQGGPCYRCLFPQPPLPSTVTNCSEGGVMGFVPGIIGSMQAQEAVKVLTGVGDVLSQRLFLYDGLSFTTKIIHLRPRQPSCDVCGDNPGITQLIDYTMFCGVPAHDKLASATILQSANRLISHQYKSKFLDAKISHILIDTRPKHEVDICKLPDSVNIPLQELIEYSSTQLLGLLNGENKPIVCVCHNGNDSQVAAKHILKQLADQNIQVLDIIGGLDAWSRKVDDTFPQY